MALYFIKDTTLKNIADAIRTKKGTDTSIAVANMASEISSITAGGCSDWEEIMPATDITFVNGEYMSADTVYPLTAGTIYKVMWNGEEFICKTIEIPFDGMNAVVMGAVEILDGEESEYPFLIGYVANQNAFAVMTTDITKDTHNVAIYKSVLPAPVIQALEITENGTFTVPLGVDGYSPVTVDVPSPEPVIAPLEVTENGTFTVPEGVDGYSPVTVDVPSSAPVIVPLEITQNGTFTAPEGVDGYSPVTVNVASGGVVGTVEKEVVFPEQTVTTAYNANFDCYFCSLGFTPVVGEIYVVTFDGVQYKDLCANWSRYTGTTSTFSGIGNSRHQKKFYGSTFSNQSDPNTDEPFFIAFGNLYTQETAGTHTLKIERLIINV